MLNVIQIQINDSTPRVFTGPQTYDRDNGGALIVPAGYSLPTGSLINGEVFWNITEKKLYRYNSGSLSWEASGGAYAPDDAQYLVLSSSATLSNERIVSIGTGLIGVDGGPGSAFNFSIDDSVVATLSGSAFSGPVVANGGLSGSLQKLSDGTSYIVAGTNVSVISSSNGQITISTRDAADLNASYLVLNATSSLNNERVLTIGTGLSGSDVGGNYTISIDNSTIATISGSTFSGPVVASGGLSGSLQNLSDGTSYLVAGTNIAIVTQSNGQITISTQNLPDLNASYLVLNTTSSLSNERSFVASNGIKSADAGPNGNYTVQIDDSVVATLSGSVFSGPVVATGGLSGSLQKLSDGTSYLIAGANVTIQSQSNGQIVISSQDASDKNASYLVLNTTSSLNNERALTLGTGLSGSDGGANGNYVLNIDNGVVATISGSTFTGPVIASGGLTGSLQKLSSGLSYLVAGGNVNILSQSSGQITISTVNSGSVLGPTTSTDNALARYDGTSGKIIQNSTVTLNDSGSFQNVYTIDFTPTDPATVPDLEGRIFYDSQDHTLAVKTDIIGTTLQVGQEMFVRVQNKTSSSILNGSAVYINGAQGNRPTIALSIATDSSSINVIGLATDDIAVDAYGYITTKGIVRDLDTHSYTVGDRLYLSTAVSGGLQNTKPTGMAAVVEIATVLRAHPTLGMVLVNLQPPQRLADLYDVGNDGPTLGAYLSGDGAFWQSRDFNSDVISATTGSFADINVQYVVLGTTSSLPNERVLTMGTGLKSVDAGAGGNYTVNINDSVVATISGSTFSGPVKASGGLSGSLQKLVDGTSYLAAGNGITINSGSSGQVTIAALICAPTGAQYLTLATDATLSAERVLTMGTGLKATDAGANGNYTVNINDSVVATISGSTFTGPIIANGGLSGSLQKLSNGLSYLVAGTNVTIVSQSSGQIVINSTATGTGGGDSAASYLVLNTTSSLSNERVLTLGTGLSGSDGGANGNYTFGINDAVVATLSGSTFSGPVITSGGLTGSLQKLPNGTSYLVAGNNITIVSGSGTNGQITITGATQAPVSAQYLTLATDTTLTAERVLTMGTGLKSVDAGAGGNYTLNIDNGIVATVSGTNFSGPVVATGGLSGSLQKLSNGLSYLAAGTNVTIASQSNGQIIVSATTQAPTNAQYLTLATNSTLSAERVLTMGTGLKATDAGANGNYTIAINNGVVATISGSTFSGPVIAGGGLTGSLQKLSSGLSYLAAGANVTITSQSNGQIIVSSTATGTGGGDAAASYLVLNTTSSLSNERALTLGTGLSGSDGGANGNYTIAINNGVVATISGSTFTGPVIASNGLSGSLQKLSNGLSYLTSSGSISITSQSSGQVSIFAPKRLLAVEFCLTEDVNNNEKYFYVWRTNSAATDSERSGNNGGLQNANSCSPYQVPFDCTIKKAVLTLKGAGVQNGSVSYPVTYQTDLFDIGFYSETKIADIDFTDINSGVQTYSPGNTDYKGSTNLNVTASLGQMLGLKFINGSAANLVGQSRNAFVTLVIEET